MISREENPAGITQADIVVGIPSLNEAATISQPTKQADKGLTKYFPGRSAVIVNCDNNSQDGTGKAFMGTVTKTPKIYLSTEDQVNGKGNNLRNLFQKAVELSARAILVVDADVTNVTPLWIRNLGEPLFEDYHFVAPLYIRHKYDGTLTSNIAYPLTRTLYGRRVRQPISGDVGFSGELARIFAHEESDSWNDAVAHYGINIWMTTIAVENRLPVIQSFMAKPRLHKSRKPTEEVHAMFHDVVGTIFDLMCRYDTFWKDVKWSRPSAVFGFGVGDVEMPLPVELEVKILSEKLAAGLAAYKELYRGVLHSDNLNKLFEVADFPAEGFEFPTGLWAKILYDFAVAYRDDRFPKHELLDALVPLFHGKEMSFAAETQAMNSQQVEEFIEDQCLQFEKTKPYLIERWFSG
jgi:glucosylglycerate synthase